MKRVIFLEDFKESEIRPDSSYRRYRDILEKEIPSFFAAQSLFVGVNCPGCGGRKAKKAFVKFGFQYRSCSKCGSLYVSPRPTAEMLREFYRSSKAVSFWRDELARKTGESRYRFQVLPMVQWVLGLVDEYLPEAKTFLDYDSKYPDFLTTINQSKKFDRAILVNPQLLGRMDLVPNNMVVCNDMSSIKEKVQVFTAFEVLERIFDPMGFLQEVYEVCQKDGLFFLTTNTISGFEYQVLGGESPRLHPPDRINLLSIEAAHDALTGMGFEVIELSTPGRVDVEIVKNVLKSNPDIPVPHIFKYILTNRDEGTWNSLQHFLQQNRLSSYLRIAARKK